CRRTSSGPSTRSSGPACSSTWARGRASSSRCQRRTARRSRPDRYGYRCGPSAGSTGIDTGVGYDRGATGRGVSVSLDVQLTVERTASAGPLLDVQELRTHFLTPRGRVKAVDGVSFTLERGRTLGVVGESGSGKTILARSIMNLLPKTNVHRSGSVRF